MPLPPDGLNDLIRRRDVEARAAVEAEVERIVALPTPTERLRAYAELLAVLREDGDALPAEAEDRILQTLRTTGSVASPPAASADTDADREARRASWERERAAMARVHVLRSWTPAAIFLAAALPFLIALVRGGVGFASLGSGAAGIGLAVAAATLLARLVPRATTLDGLTGLVLGAFVAGTAGLALAQGLLSF
jgi:hypothetical protein